MGFSSGSMQTFRQNRNLRTSKRFGFDKSRVEGFVSNKLPYNPDFEKKVSKQTILKRQAQVRAELKRERIKGLLLTAIVAPIILSVCWHFLKIYWSYLSMG